MQGAVIGSIALTVLAGQGLGFLSGEWQGIARKQRKQIYAAIILLIIATVIMASGDSFAKGLEPSTAASLDNEYFQVEVFQSGTDVNLRLYDKQADFYRSDGPYIYRAVRSIKDGEQVYLQLENVKVQSQGDLICVTGKLAGLEYEQTFRIPKDKPYIEEQIKLTNQTGSTVCLREFESRMQIKVAEAGGQILPPLAQDHFMAIPFLHRATDPQGHRNDFTLEHILKQGGRDFQAGGWPPGRVSDKHFLSDAWAWRHGEGSFGIFSLIRIICF